ncbi:MAG: response regulator [Trueperaceae bacterium]|nr:response regulator [Trueperaceae bacterium]
MLFTPEVLVASPRESQSLEHVIKGLGFTTQSESTGSGVLAHLRGNTPDLIILNALLPEITGTSIAYRVKKVKRLAEVPIILLVDAHNAKLRAEAELSGVKQVILTPFQFGHMRGILSNLLAHKMALRAEEGQADFVSNT